MLGKSHLQSPKKIKIGSESIKVTTHTAAVSDMRSAKTFLAMDNANGKTILGMSCAPDVYNGPQISDRQIRWYSAP